ncbi:hypothetical protein JCGZ_23078 [Jatropha curcas]|uniref:Nudix hydrolase domain-containing protein n=1 Tax=Jatropha curcas TaxID=180498 RepID=A0A067JTE0_JATCU|nr:hypothetical protein JCGZ_23078 [Jatropha curcas]
MDNRVDDQMCRVEERVIVLMISTPNRSDLVFPKGGWEDDESLDQAARREAMEEAGVKGILSKNPIGVWEFRSKSSKNSCSSSGGCKGYMFALEVTEELDHWPGQPTYTRKWLNIEEAFKMCRYEWMREALKNFLAELSKPNDRSHGDMEETPMVAPGCFLINPPAVLMNPPPAHV